MVPALDTPTPSDDAAAAVAEVAALTNLLVFGSDESRRRLARELADGDRPGVRQLLVATVTSAGPWELRARCLEVLGAAAGAAGRDLAEVILDALVTPVELDPPAGL